MASDLELITAWWRGRRGDGFIALPPPTRSRYTQSDGHDDAALAIASQGAPATTSFAYWHWQSHAAFERSGQLTGTLYLHWGGDHAVVATGLGSAPAGFALIDGGPHGAFQLEKITLRDARGLPDPADAAGVNQFLKALDALLEPRMTPFSYRALSDAEEEWLHDRLAALVDLSAIVPFLTSLGHRDAITAQEADRLLSAWRVEYAGTMDGWSGWRVLLRALLRHDRPGVTDVVDELGPQTAPILAGLPSQRSLEKVRGFALAGDGEAAAEWVHTHAAVHATDPLTAAIAIGADLQGHGGTPEVWEALGLRLPFMIADPWRGGPYAVGAAAGWEPTEKGAIARVRIALDDRLPQPLRAATARSLRNDVERMRGMASSLDPDAILGSGYSVADFLRDLDRFDAAVDELLAGTGPSLTDTESSLTDAWGDYRALSAADTAWLHAQVASPRTQLQGLGFCLELLYAHGQATLADLESLRPRWKNELAKKYETTYTEWRHPLVLLTCLARDLDHPLAVELDEWWAKPAPAWKNDLRLLTLLGGAATEQKAAELWAFISSDGEDDGHVLTWVLMRARLDGTDPVRVADTLLTSRLREFVTHRVLFAAVDPAQPLWRYALDSTSRSWRERIREVAENRGLSRTARAVAQKAAKEHEVIVAPERPVDEEHQKPRVARAWFKRRT